MVEKGNATDAVNIFRICTLIYLTFLRRIATVGGLHHVGSLGQADTVVRSFRRTVPF